LTGQIMVAQSAGWWFPFKDTVILTERPTYLLMKEKKLRHIEYRDGFTVSNLSALEQLAYEPVPGMVEQ